MKKRILSFLLVLVIAIGFLPTIAFANETSGSCGDDVIWSYDESTKTLTVSGNGEMSEYNPIFQTPPWEEYQDNIEHLVVSEGVTYFSGGSIAKGHTSLITISFPKSLTGNIGYIGLWSYPNLTDFYYAGSITDLYEIFPSLFNEIPDNVTMHYGEPFQDPTPPSNVYYTKNIPESIKVGDLMPKMDITYHNLTPGIEYYTYVSDATGEDTSWSLFYTHPYDRDQGSSTIVAEDGTLKNQEDATDEQVAWSYAYKPGYYKITPAISATNPPFGQWEIGNPIYLKIEEPIITHTAPTDVLVGETIQFDTALTNVNLKNHKVSEYENIEPTTCWTKEEWQEDGSVVYRSHVHSFGELNAIAYKPTVEVISGFDMVERNNMDYSNTLSSSESIKFTKEGTVVLKINYNQIKTMSCSWDCYDYSKIITINVGNKKAEQNTEPTPTPEPTPVEKPIVDTTAIFSDVVQDWYTSYVNYAYTYSIFKGNEDGTFKPLSNITRAEFVQVLANITGVDTSNKQLITKFVDAKPGDWFTPAVKWANENGIVAGKNATQFGPEENITREQMCVMIVNYAKFKGITLKAVEAKEAFVDDAAISSWAKDAVYACQMADIVNGKGGGRFDPAGTGLRAEASVIFTKFHQSYLR